MLATRLLIFLQLSLCAKFLFGKNVRINSVHAKTSDVFTDMIPSNYVPTSLPTTSPIVPTIRYSEVMLLNNTAYATNQNVAEYCFDVNLPEAMLILQTFDSECYDTTVSGDTYIRLRRDSRTGEEIAGNDDYNYPYCSDSQIIATVSSGKYCLVMGCYSSFSCEYRAKIIVAAVTASPTVSPNTSSSAEPVEDPTAEPTDTPVANPTATTIAVPTATPSVAVGNPYEPTAGNGVSTMYTGIMTLQNTDSASNPNTGVHCFDVEGEGQVLLVVQTFDTECYDLRVGTAGDSFIRLRSTTPSGVEIANSDDVRNPSCTDSKISTVVTAGRFCLMMGCYSTYDCSYRAKIVLDTTAAMTATPTLRPTVIATPTATPTVSPSTDPTSDPTLAPSFSAGGELPETPTAPTTPLPEPINLFDPTTGPTSAPLGGGAGERNDDLNGSSDLEVIYTEFAEMTATNYAQNAKTSSSYCFDVSTSTGAAKLVLQTFNNVCSDSSSGDPYIRLRMASNDGTLNGTQIAYNDDLEYPTCIDSQIVRDVKLGRFCLIMGCFDITACSYSAKIVISTISFGELTSGYSGDEYATGTGLTEKTSSTTVEKRGKSSAFSALQRGDPATATIMVCGLVTVMACVAVVCLWVVMCYEQACACNNHHHLVKAMDGGLEMGTLKGGWKSGIMMPNTELFVDMEMSFDLEDMPV